jgi:hypothetical protein
MKLRHLSLFALLGAALVLTGCDSGRKAPARTNVRIVNVAPHFVQLGYIRGQQRGVNTLETLAFKGATAHDYDVDTYDFSVFERTLPNTTPRSWTVTRQLVAGNDYAFLLAEVAGEESTQIVEYPAKIANSTDTQVAAIHTDEGLPPVDVYLEPAGVGIAGATPRGTLAFLAQLAPTTLASGDYELTITAAGDPTTVLFTSATLTLAAGATTVFALVNEGGLGTAAMSVVMLQDNPANLYSTDATAEVRVINAANDGQPRDFAVNSEFAPPLFSAVPYGTMTSYATVPIAGDLAINVTPAGNPGVLEINSTMSTAPGQRYTVIFTGEAGTLSYIIANDDGRRITDEPKLRFFAAASQFATGTEFVFMPPGTADQTTIAPYALLVSPGVSPFDAVVPGTYDLLLRETVTNTVRAGPIPVTFANGGIYTVLMLNGPDTATANVVFLDDQP